MKYQDEKQVTKQYISEMYRVLDIYPAVAAVVKSFDGKVFNKRFYKALEPLDGVHGYTDSYGRIEIYTKISVSGSVGAGRGYRYNNQDHHFLYMSKNQLPENKRIDAEAWLLELKKNMIRLYKDIKKAEAALDKIDDVLTEWEYIKKRVDVLRDSVPYCMQDWFRCGYYLRTS